MADSDDPVVVDHRPPGDVVETRERRETRRPAERVGPDLASVLGAEGNQFARGERRHHQVSIHRRAGGGNHPGTFGYGMMAPDHEAVRVLERVNLIVRSHHINAPAKSGGGDTDRHADGALPHFLAGGRVQRMNITETGGHVNAVGVIGDATAEAHP